MPPRQLYNNGFPNGYPTQNFQNPMQQTTLQQQMLYQPALQQPQTTTQMQSALNIDIAWVQGELAAKAYPVARGRRVWLLDQEGPYLYVKGTDDHGLPLEMEAYELRKKQLSNAAVSDTSNFITRQELDEKFDALLKKLDERPKKNYNQHYNGRRKEYEEDHE